MQYAHGDLSARSLCTIAWHAIRAGAQGLGLKKLAFNPENQSGSFQQHLDRVLPQNSDVELVDLKLPLFVDSMRQD
eukprot:1331686-Pyramimonas_sp.AAC.1